MSLHLTLSCFCREARNLEMGRVEVEEPSSSPCGAPPEGVSVAPSDFCRDARNFETGRLEAPASCPCAAADMAEVGVWG